MNTVIVENCKTLFIGRRGENEVTEVVFDFTEWQEQFGAGVIDLYVKRSVDFDAYPVVLSIDGTVATWLVTATDTDVVGSGKIEFVYTVDQKVAKSAIFPFYVGEDIGQASSEPPDPYESWIETLTELGTETQANAQAAAQSASDAADSAASASESAGQAEDSAEDAEAWAVGERNGEPVSAGDETYENNAKYWAENARANAPVQSVNGKDGNVELTLDDIQNGETYARATPAQLAQIGKNADDIADIDAMIPSITSESNHLVNVSFLTNRLTSYRTSAAQDTIDAGKQDKITAYGILKRDRSGNITAAIAGADYVTADALNSYRKATAQDAIDNAQNQNIDKNTTAINTMQPAATAGDIGKALIVKTVADGKPTSYEYGAAGGGGSTLTAGDGIDIANDVISNTQGIEYIVGTQTAATSKWTGVSTDETLKVGKIIAYYLPFAGTSTVATLALTMADGTTTREISLQYKPNSSVTTQFPAGSIIILVYDGTYWRVNASYDTDTNTYPTGYCVTNGSVAAKAAACSFGYRGDTNYFPCLFRFANTATDATLAITTYAPEAAPIYVNGARTSASNTFGAGVILFLYYNGAYYCYNDGRFPILVDGTVTSVQEYAAGLLVNYRTAADQDVIDDAQDERIEDLEQTTTATTIGPSAIATFDASAANMPLKGLTVNVEPIQDLHGYDSPWPAGGGVNKFPLPAAGTVNGITLTHNLDGSITIAGTANANAYFDVFAGDFDSAAYAGYKFCAIGTHLEGVSFRISGSNRVAIQSFAVNGRATSIADNGSGLYFSLRISSGTAIPSGGLTIKPMLVAASESTETFAPYSNICPISGRTSATVTRTGKNLFQLGLVPSAKSGVTVTDIPGGYSLRATSASSYVWARFRLLDAAKFAGKTLTVKGKTVVSASQSTQIALQYRDTSDVLVLNANAAAKNEYATATLTLPSDAAGNVSVALYCATTPAASIGDTAEWTELQLEIGSAATDYEPYQGDTYTIQLGDTVYGGTLDVTGGKMVVDRAMVMLDGTNKKFGYKFPDKEVYQHTLSTPAKAVSGMVLSKTVCDRLPTQPDNTVQAASADAISTNSPGTAVKVCLVSENLGSLASANEWLTSNPLQVCYELATPLEITLTPTQIETLLGTNNIWADTGDVSITYGAYLETVKSYADKVGDSILSAIAPLEASYTASRAYAAGSFLFVWTKFYKVTAAISSGDTITPDTNVTQTTVAEQLMALANV